MSVSYKRPLSEPLVLYQKLLANAFRYSKYFANFNKRKPWTFRFVSTLWGTDHWCLYYTKLAPIFKTKDNFTRHARGNLKLHHTLGEHPANPPRGFGGHQKQKIFLHFPIWRAEEFLLNGKENFVSGVLPSRIQAVDGAKGGFRQGKTN